MKKIFSIFMLILLVLSILSPLAKATDEEVKIKEIEEAYEIYVDAYDYAKVQLEKTCNEEEFLWIKKVLKSSVEGIRGAKLYSKETAVELYKVGRKEEADVLVDLALQFELLAEEFDDLLLVKWNPKDCVEANALIDEIDEFIKSIFNDIKPVVNPIILEGYVAPVVEETVVVEENDNPIDNTPVVDPNRVKYDDFKSKYDDFDDNYDSYKRKYKDAVSDDDSRDIKKYKKKLLNLDDDLDDLEDDVEDLIDEVDDQGLIDDLEDLDDDIGDLQKKIKNLVADNEENTIVPTTSSLRTVREVAPPKTVEKTEVILNSLDIPSQQEEIVGVSNWSETRRTALTSAGIVMVLATVVFLLAVLLK